MGAFCIRSCPFSSLSSSFTSKSLQSWTQSVSRNASESGWKRSNRRSRKPPVHQLEPHAAAVSDFPGTAGRRTHRKPKNRTLRRRAGALAENARIGKNGGGESCLRQTWNTPKWAESGDFGRRGEKAARKQEKCLTLFCVRPSTSARSAGSFGG